MSKFAWGAAAISAVLLMSSPSGADELSEAYAKGLEQFRAENYDAALPHFRRTLELAEERYGADDPKVAVELNNLAEVYRLMGDYGAAEPLYERALALDEKNLDAGSPDLATSLNNLALLYRAQGRLGEAEELYERSLDILENALGPRHPNVAKSLNNLAVLYDAQGRRNEATALIERAVSISGETLGPNHPTTVTLAKNLETMELDGAEETVVAAAPAPTTEPAVEPTPTTPAQEQSVAQIKATEQQSPAVQQAAAIEPAAGTGDYVIHLASVRSAEAAAAEWRRLLGIYDLPEGLQQHEPRKISTANGEFYRVWGGMFPSEEAAAKICGTVTAKGDYCKVMRTN